MPVGLVVVGVRSARTGDPGVGGVPATDRLCRVGSRDPVRKAEVGVPSRM